MQKSTCLAADTLINDIIMQESRGAHAREDFTKRDDEKWMKHTVAYFDHLKSGKDKVSIDYRPVHDQPLDKEMKHIPPFARTY